MYAKRICFSCFRLKNSNRLENSLQNGKTLVSSYENKLAREEVAPAEISALEKTQRELAVSNATKSHTITYTLSYYSPLKNVMRCLTCKIFSASDILDDYTMS